MIMLKLTSLNLKKDKAETLAIPVCEDKSIHTDAALNAVIKKAKLLKEFSGKKDQVLTLYDPAGIKVKRVMLVGLGKHKKIDLEILRNMAGNTVKNCIKKEFEHLWFALPDLEKIKLDKQSALEAMLEGALLANHEFNKYKGDKKKTTLKKIHFITAPATVKKFSRLPSRTTAVCRSTILARDWISTPSNDKTPEKLARAMISLARKAGLRTQILKESQLKQQKFGAMLSVSAGSQSKPSLLILEHKPKDAKKTIALTHLTPVVSISRPAAPCPI
jgi:leucyl aminopeptidase